MKRLFIFSIILLLFSCKEDPDPIIVNPGPTIVTGEEVDTIIPTGDEAYLNKDSDYIFDQTQLHTFELNIPEASFTQINSNPTAEKYVEGGLTFEGETISPIGVRYKGSIGAFVGCVSGPDWANPSGHKTCTKLSMKIKVNWDDPEARFYGLKKIQLHSQNNDPSQMRERLGYWLFRAMDVPAPRSVHARLIINGEYYGVYALTEQIDGRFTRYNYDDGTGNLYKEIWPLHMNGQPHAVQTYLDHLKTNEDENPTPEIIHTFAQEVASATPANRPSVVANWMNIDEVISYAAVDRTIRNDDGAFHWYCNNGICDPHNFYWYEEPSANTVHLIPWDLDHAFINIISNENPVTPIADDWGETTANCQPFNYGAFFFPQWSASCDKLTAAWASYENEYDDKVITLKEGPMSKAQTDALLDTWETQIRNATQEASDTHDDAISIAQWENEIADLKVKLEYARNN